MNCSECALTTDYVFCEISVTGGGSDVSVTISYGDSGPNDVFVPLSKYT